MCEGSEHLNKGFKMGISKGLKPNWISIWIPLREISETTLIEKKHSGLLLLIMSSKTQVGKDKDIGSCP